MASVALVEVAPGMKKDACPEASVTVTMAELMLEATAEATDEASVTGQMVVSTPTIDVTMTVEMAPDGKLEMAADRAAVFVAAGQFVTVAAQEITVWM